MGSQAPDWPAAERTVAAAVLDLLWAVGSYERLVADWDMDPEQAVGALGWAIEVIIDAILVGRCPATAATP